MVGMRINLSLPEALVLSGSLFLGACKKDEAAPKDKPVTETKEAPKDKPPEPAKVAPDFSAWDPAGKAKAWTGSWVVKENGIFQAWTVAADGKVDVREGDKDKTYKLEVEIPCTAYFATDQGMKFPHPFTVTADGKVRSNAGGGGYKKGAEAIFCDGSGTIYVLGADGKCTTWTKDFEWKKADGDCSLAKNAEGKDVFKHGDPNGGEFDIDGDAILGGQSPTESAADHEAAKAAAVAKNTGK
jgi:hypothetical protein